MKKKSLLTKILSFTFFLAQNLVFFKNICKEDLNICYQSLKNLLFLLNILSKFINNIINMLLTCYLNEIKEFIQKILEFVLKKLKNKYKKRAFDY